MMLKRFEVWGVLLLLIGFSILPFFGNLSYQINLYLTWEGAYRLYLGQVPFKDFGIPMGACYWYIPMLFFKLFGPSLGTLIKAQFFINIVSGLSFYWILRILNVEFAARLGALLVYCFTFILGIYWPQYNHTAIVFQLLAIAFLLAGIFSVKKYQQVTFSVLSGILFSISFFTKQDAGAMGILIGIILAIYAVVIDKHYLRFSLFLLSLLVTFSFFILPNLKYEIGYWFNYGQDPHNSRLHLTDFLSVILERSHWEKFYFGCILIIIFIQKNPLTTFFSDFRKSILALLTLGLLTEALLFQVTSYIPKDNNIFFHAFAVAFLLDTIAPYIKIKPLLQIALLSAGIAFWWSGTYWRYIERVIPKQNQSGNSDQIGISSYLNSTSGGSKFKGSADWITTNKFKAFEKVKLPKETILGMARLAARYEGNSLETLNMTELTPLAYEFGFTPKVNQPLWYHLGVGMFSKELAYFEQKIEGNYYDIILFENIPELNNFFPFRISELAKEKYDLVDTFPAPRMIYDGTIEVYVRKKK